MVGRSYAYAIRASWRSRFSMRPRSGQISQPRERIRQPATPAGLGHRPDLRQGAGSCLPANSQASLLDPEVPAIVYAVVDDASRPTSRSESSSRCSSAAGKAPVVDRPPSALPRDSAGHPNGHPVARAATSRLLGRRGLVSRIASEGVGVPSYLPIRVRVDAPGKRRYALPEGRLAMKDLAWLGVHRGVHALDARASASNQGSLPWCPRRPSRTEPTCM